MFQTEPILYLQSLGNEYFTFLMVLITTMGSAPFLIAILVAIIFGVDFKKGFLLFQLLLWTGLVTTVIKILVAFPRPDFVDKRVVNLQSGIKNTSPFNGSGSEGIFELPDKEVLKAFRHQEALRLQEAFISSPFGFPSGHVALTTAFLGGSAYIFNSRFLTRITPLIIVIMSFSRMYLGRHFLGDVLGGAMIGLIFVTAFTLFLKSSLKDDIFKKENFELTFRPKNLLFYSFMFVIPILLTALSLVTADITGLFIGTNLAYILILRKGIPDDTGSAAQRATRVLIALMIFGAAGFILEVEFQTAGTISYLQFTLIEFFKTFIPSFTIWISVAICTKLDLYRRDKEVYEQRR